MMTHTDPIPRPANDDAALLDFLRERDIACPLCRYNLRALTSPRCPECGRELKLTIGLVEPRQGAWLTAQIGVSAAAGIGLLLVFVIALSGWPTGNNRQRLMDAAIVYFLTAIPLAAALLMTRRRCLRLSPWMQWTMAVVAWVLTAAAIIAVPMSDR